MAVFANLHDAGSALASHLRRSLSPTLQDVVAGPPIDNPATATESLRISLLWVTPQPTHRNDDWATGTDGRRRPPPVSLSAFYLITAYGTTGAGEPTQAINRLGQALQAVETDPVITLPLGDDLTTPGSDPIAGEGTMNASLVPMAADLMEKVFTPLQMRHRPWALVEVGPVQLDRLLAAEPAVPVVAPGGIRLTGPGPAAPPVVNAVSPERVRPGGRLRLDTHQAADAQALRLGPHLFTFADTPAAVDEIARPDQEGRVFVTCPAGAVAADVDVVLRGPTGTSAPVPLTVGEPEQPGLDAPDAPLARGADLVLTGGGLAEVDRVYLWPARGMAAPAEVVDLPPAEVAAAAVRVAGADLVAAGLRGLPYRVAVRSGTGPVSPFVLVEVQR
ncbi:Protein of unknown function [Blastococcus sp. DSM 46786]|uniref:Pvc16 family protein n=1 Tax=Blastococcus sp. DSM 46786 TaxID=1798227 RepID=UPI0008D58E02|nr:Pvc16 family protein [Blastococcus sp. DSM 46786]SEK59449.1 Protein of unknown function [Blastococcus sp. DSM 46786]